MITDEILMAGAQRLQQPVLPLVGIVQFIYLTGDFTTVAEVIKQLPTEIATTTTLYRDPAAHLAPYLELLEPLAAFKAGEAPSERIVGPDGQPVDAMTATMALVAQAVLVRELEQINSLLCAPCGCTLCCVGPEPNMVQRYFEIPLRPEETALFAAPRIDDPESRSQRADREPPLQVAGRDFFERTNPALIHWQSGWSLILPTASRCPNLEESGRCQVYADRPLVCRRPQIFAYVVEPVEDAVGATTEPQPPVWRLRQTLLAVVDCPYVRQLRDLIASYAAACELELVLRHNKA